MCKRFCRIDIDKSCKIKVDGILAIGTKQNKKSKSETDITLKENSEFNVSGRFSIGAGCNIRVLKNAKLEIKSGYINGYTTIVCAKNIKIGEDVAIARDVIIRDTDGHNILYEGYEKDKEVIIGNHVWIGNKAMILKGVTIGDGAVIAAGAIVNNDVPEKSLVAGVPARVIKTDIEWK